MALLDLGEGGGGFCALCPGFATDWTGEGREAVQRCDILHSLWRCGPGCPLPGFAALGLVRAANSGLRVVELVGAVCLSWPPPFGVMAHGG